MMLAFMLHALVASALASIAAWFTERALRLRGAPARFTWLTSIVMSLALTPASMAIGWIFPRASLLAPMRVTAGDAPDRLLRGAMHLAADPFAARVERIAVIVWALLTIAVLMATLVAFARVRRDRATWTDSVIEDEPVLLSDRSGPAVVGFTRPRIVLPRWVLELDAHLRSLVVLHEREHLRARDPWLIGAALVAVVLEPWNLALWWQLARLRLALEIDCDARVLRVRPDVRRYGQLLLVVGHRSTDALPLLAPALAEYRSPLSRRIAAMTAVRTRAHVVQAIAAAAGALVVFAIACSMPIPTDERPAGREDRASGTPRLVSTTTEFKEFQVEKAVVQSPASVGPRYPDVLRDAGVEGEVLAQFVVDTSGVVLPGSLKILKSSHELFSQAVGMALPIMRFVPAEVGGRKVRQLVQQPFTFAIAK